MKKSGCRHGATTTTSCVMFATTGSLSPRRLARASSVRARQYFDDQHFVVGAVGLRSARDRRTRCSGGGPAGRARSSRRSRRARSR